VIGLFWKPEFRGSLHGRYKNIFDAFSKINYFKTATVFEDTDVPSSSGQWCALRWCGLRVTLRDVLITHCDARFTDAFHAATTFYTAVKRNRRGRDVKSLVILRACLRGLPGGRHSVLISQLLLVCFNRIQLSIFLLFQTFHVPLINLKTIRWNSLWHTTLFTWFGGNMLVCDFWSRTVIFCDDRCLLLQ
jgi:hypothetical protein